MCVVRSCVYSFLIVPESAGVASQQRDLWKVGVDECSSRRGRLFFEEGRVTNETGEV